MEVKVFRDLCEGDIEGIKGRRKRLEMKLEKMPRNETSRKLQIAITHIQTAELWLKDALAE